VVYTLGARVDFNLKQRHQLRLYALATVEQRRANVKRTHLGRPRAAPPHQTVHCRERHGHRILVLAAQIVPLCKTPTCEQAQDSIARLEG
jgi:hypothetical protein